MRLFGFFCGLLLAACNGGQPPSDAISKVYKADGSKQCESSGQSVEEMAQELEQAGIDVICGQKGHDGYGYAAVCGNDTGQINIYSIHSQNLSDAEQLGFAPTSDLSDYQDQACD